ncbi:MAG: hypothetical protein H0V62_10400 [Gammaproteobacteria bacterium]|nr:hypothetical protein [Gammaproteobacteria bacterium]
MQSRLFLDDVNGPDLPEIEDRLNAKAFPNGEGAGVAGITKQLAAEVTVTLGTVGDPDGHAPTI